MDTSRAILGLARRFFAGTVLSRVSGVAREVVMAFCFGSAPEIAAFMVSYRLAHLFRRLFGEGNFQVGFVPRFESLNAVNKEKALFFYRDCVFSLLAILLAVVFAMEAVLWICSQWIDPGWVEIVHLTMWMAPGLLFICLYALNSAFLQCQKNFFAPAAAPMLFNLAWIVAALFAARFPLVIAVRALSVGVIFSFACQWAFTALQVRKFLSPYIPWKQWVRPTLFSQDWKSLVKPLTLGIVGVGAMQINSALDAIFARIADLSGPAYLWYASRLQQLPLALFGIALSSAALPSLSRAMQAGNVDHYRTLLATALRHGSAIMIPCTCGLFALGNTGLSLLYAHGHFQGSDIQQTLYCLWGYGAGLIPAAFTLLLATGFYARTSYSLPTLASLLAILFNVACNALMVFVLHWGTVSIAIGTSASAFLNCLFLSVSLRKNVGPIFPASFWGDFARLMISGIVATALTLFAGFGALISSSSPLEQIVRFMAAASLYVATFFAMAYMLKARDFFALFKKDQERGSAP